MRTNFTYRWFVPTQPPEDHEQIHAAKWTSGKAIAWNTLRSHPRALTLLTIGALVDALTGTLTSMVVGRTTEAVFTNGTTAAQAWRDAAIPALVLVALFLVTWVFVYTADALTDLSQSRVVHRSRLYLTEALLRAQHPPAQSSGTILSTVDADTNQLGKIKYIANFPVIMLAFLLSSAVALWPASPWISITMLVGCAATVWASNLTAKPISRVSAERRKLEAVTVALATDVAQGSRVVKGLGAVDTTTQQFDAAAEQALSAMLNDARVTGVQHVLRQLVPTAFSILTLGIAIVLASNGSITTADLVTTTLLAPPALTVTGVSLGMLSDLWGRAVAGGNRVHALMQDLQAQEVAQGEAAQGETAQRETAQGNAMPHEDREMRTASASAAADAAAADARIVARLTEPGITVLVAHTDAAHQHAQRLLRLIASRDDAIVAPHAVSVFAGTLQENILPTHNRNDAAPLEKALWAAACEDIVARLGGTQGLIGEAGLTLSGGQRQRVALARALAANPDVLVLDEPATGLDAITLATVATRLKHMRTGQSTIIVSTSRAWRSVADKVVEL